MNDQSRLLACAAVVPELRSVLCFDLDADELWAAAAMLADALTVVDERPHRPLVLLSTADEEQLWSTVSWESDRSALRFKIGPGPLAPHDDGDPLPLVVIRDLTALGLAAARACVMLMGADVAHLERHGRQARWRPRNAWIAGCPAAAVGQVTPHLVDRFAVRVPSPPRARRGGWERLPDRMLARARSHRPRPGRPSLDRVLDFAPPAGAQGARRGLALARLAVAGAKLDGDGTVEARHVDQAAALLGLRAAGGRPAGPAAAPRPDAPPSNGQAAAPAPSSPGCDPLEGQAARPGGDAVVLEPVHAGQPAEPLDSARMPLTEPPTAAYPEDDAPADREMEPLRLPASAPGARGVGRGMVIGVEPATDLRDIAVTSTILEALKFQPARYRAGDDGGLRVAPTDLRSHRRAPAPQVMLALVLDCSCRAGWDWTESFMPFLRWGYAERASVCVVKVGAGDAACELVAERLVARNVLDPRIAAALDAQPGRATPLAHGLDLAAQTIQHALHHGPAAVRDAWLVVVTDGRGNVPLESSLSRVSPPAPVGRRGIDDALAVAAKIHALVGVRSVVVDPEPDVGADLPHALARALGATVVTREGSTEASSAV